MVATTTTDTGPPGDDGGGDLAHGRSGGHDARRGGAGLVGTAAAPGGRDRCGTGRDLRGRRARRPGRRPGRGGPGRPVADPVRAGPARHRPGPPQDARPAGHAAPHAGPRAGALRRQRGDRASTSRWRSLRRHVDAVVYTYGASGDRRLGVPGEELPGSLAATDLVAWYCGHPDADRPRVRTPWPTRGTSSSSGSATWHCTWPGCWPAPPPSCSPPRCPSTYSTRWPPPRSSG